MTLQWRMNSKIEERLIERSKFWSAHFNDFKIGAQCRAWNQAIPRSAGI